MEKLPDILTRTGSKIIGKDRDHELEYNYTYRGKGIRERDRGLIKSILQENMENKAGSRNSYLKKAHVSQRSVENPELKKFTDLLKIYSPGLKKYTSLNFKRNLDKKKWNNEPLEESKYQNVVNLLQLSNGISVSRQFEGYFTYFVGPGNNDALIRTIMGKKKNWVKIPFPHTANFIWTQVRKASMLNLLPRVQKVKRIAVSHHTDLPALLSTPAYTVILPTNNLNPILTKLYNRLEGNSELSDKKKLFFNLAAYYKSQNKPIFSCIPMTFHIVNGISDSSFLRFLSKYQEIQLQMANDKYLNNCWIIKPGESTNRGNGISLSSQINEIAKIINEKVTHKGTQRTYIIQKYLYRPLLYKNRKFDIRCYVLVTCINNNIQGYFYKEGYLRTSCQEFSIENISDKFIHLTNDAIQKFSSNYGLFEDSNKLSYRDFQMYLDETLTEKVDFEAKVLKKMKEIAKDSIIATSAKLNPNNRLHSFELFGYDFMIDEFFSPWLIEVNTNPCLELAGDYLKVLIPTMLKAALNISVDQVFETDSISYAENCFELIFSETKY